MPKGFVLAEGGGILSEQPAAVCRGASTSVRRTFDKWQVLDF